LIERSHSIVVAKNRHRYRTSYVNLIVNVEKSASADDYQWDNANGTSADVNEGVGP